MTKSSKNGGLSMTPWPCELMKLASKVRDYTFLKNAADFTPAFLRRLYDWPLCDPCRISSSYIPMCCMWTISRCHRGQSKEEKPHRVVFDQIQNKWDLRKARPKWEPGLTIEYRTVQPTSVDVRRRTLVWKMPGELERETNNKRGWKRVLKGGWRLKWWITCSDEFSP